MLTYLCHSTASFAVMYNGACDVVGRDLRLRGVYAAAEIHNASRRRGGDVAARRTRAERLYFNDNLRSSLLFDLKGS